MKLEWGKKRTCDSCGEKFYDMRKKSLVCPNCYHEFKIADVQHKNFGNNIYIDEIDLDDKIVDLSPNYHDEELINNVNDITTSSFTDRKNDDEK